MSQRLFYHPDLIFPSGKLSGNVRKPLAVQKGDSCLIYSFRRLAVMDPDKNSPAMAAYKEVKKMMKTMDLSDLSEENYNALYESGIKICKNANLDWEEEIYNLKAFQSRHLNTSPPLDKKEFLERHTIFGKCVLLYNVLIEKILMPLMKIKKSAWVASNDSAGFNSLKHSLEENGPHLFLGKFGATHYSKPPILSQTMSTHDRKVYYFDKSSAETSPVPLFIHWVLVDKVDIVANREMVFYRDSNHSSVPGSAETVYMQSFPSFLDRLADPIGSLRRDNLDYLKNAAFGLISMDLEKHYQFYNNLPIQKEPAESHENTSGVGKPCGTRF